MFQFGSLPIAETMAQLEQHGELLSRVKVAKLSEVIDNIGAQSPPNKNIDGLNNYYLNMPAIY
jgi:hypothetical protein